MNFCQNKCKSKWLFVILTALMCFGLVRVYYRVTDDFRLANMTYDIPHHQEWEIEPLAQAEQENLDKILNQKFYYLGKGAQSYVFTSEDQKYVIKFFKFKHLKPSLFVDLLPPAPPFADFKLKEKLRKDRKLHSVFNGYRLAYGVHKEETALVYLHLNKTDHLKRSVVVKDKIGLTHVIDLDSIVFLIQEKGETLRTVMQHALKKGDLATAKKRIRQIMDLYYAEYQKGIYDHDHGVMHNTGFVGEKPIHLDVGKLNRDAAIRDLAVYKKDLQIIYNKIDKWYKDNYPEYREELAKDMQDKFLSLTRE